MRVTGWAFASASVLDVRWFWLVRPARRRRLTLRLRPPGRRFSKWRKCRFSWSYQQGKGWQRCRPFFVPKSLNYFFPFSLNYFFTFSLNYFFHKALPRVAGYGLQGPCRPQRKHGGSAWMRLGCLVAVSRGRALQNLLSLRDNSRDLSRQKGVRDESQNETGRIKR